tara:strand:- start:580 stop:1293 length:714 start_codon:yes stop_codon:yes gene_type:complete
MPLVINDTTPLNQYTATSGQVDFTISFEFFATTDIKVYNGDTVLTFNASPGNATQYSVTGAGTNGTKKITLGSPGATTGNVITILRDIPVKRTSDFPTSGPFNIDVLNTELDTLTSMIAERESETLYSLRVPENDPSGASLILPGKATRSSKVLGFDSNGDPVVTTLTLAAIEADSAGSAVAAANSATAAANSATASASSASSASSAATTALAAKITVSTSSPTGGSDGDIWFKVSS